MSVNRYRPHVLVLPEDDANRQIANGFILHPNLNARAIQVLPPSGGWKKVLEEFAKVHVPEMQNVRDRRMVLLMDFDRDEERLVYIQNPIPEALKNRVFVLGVLPEPERLKSDTQMTFEEIGEALANDCSENTNELWGYELLDRNRGELNRLIVSVKPFLFR
jgi:hypothetical protein